MNQMESKDIYGTAQYTKQAKSPNHDQLARCTNEWYFQSAHTLGSPGSPGSPGYPE